MTRGLSPDLYSSGERIPSLIFICFIQCIENAKGPIATRAKCKGSPWALKCNTGGVAAPSIAAPLIQNIHTVGGTAGPIKLPCALHHTCVSGLASAWGLTLCIVPTEDLIYGLVPCHTCSLQGQKFGHHCTRLLGRYLQGLLPSPL